MRKKITLLSVCHKKGRGIKTIMNKCVLDPCCGSRMAWYDKDNPNVVFMDNRKLDETLCDGRRLVVSPDVVGDFRHMPFSDESFYL
ncbi:hypothetical protein [Jonquetella anthropi]|uniref:hypothetical protein n=1 Tax=Jonquetella anthropi TaxID=428712 RepID=UPI0018C8C876|nr:hypothetical protein [Jonquetella anthropi]